MKRLLDELAAALHKTNGRRYPRRVALSDELFRQFGLPITPSRWAELAQQLPCALPPLQRRPEGLWSFPRGWTSVWDLARYLSERHPDWELPANASAPDWVEAQVFIGIRESLVEALNVDESQVVRSARLMADLGAE